VLRAVRAAEGRCQARRSGSASASLTSASARCTRGDAPATPSDRPRSAPADAGTACARGRSSSANWVAARLGNDPLAHVDVDRPRHGRAQ
jgi:hypothetical protein